MTWCSLQKMNCKLDPANMQDPAPVGAGEEEELPWAGPEWVLHAVRVLEHRTMCSVRLRLAKVGITCSSHPGPCTWGQSGMHLIWHASKLKTQRQHQGSDDGAPETSHIFNAPNLSVTSLLNVHLSLHLSD